MSSTIWIQTFTGKRFWPTLPRIEDIDILDIAHSLSNLCRYGGHCRTFYSVGQHSLLCALMCAELGHDLALTALMHDAAEAYLVDVPRPLKAALGGYSAYEDQLYSMIAEKYGLIDPIPAVVKEIDNRMMMTEGPQLCARQPDGTAWWDDGDQTFDIKIDPWPSGEAKDPFLYAFEGLVGMPWRLSGGGSERGVDVGRRIIAASRISADASRED